MQAAVETCKINLKTRRVNFAKGDITQAKGKLEKGKPAIMKAVPITRKEAATTAYAQLLEDIGPLQDALAQSDAAGQGSPQQRSASDLAFVAQDKVATDLSRLQELLVPENFKRDVPSEYANIPQLQGRATVAFQFDRPGGEPFNVDGVNYDKIDIKMVVDGYNAPVTAGNFVDLVKRGYYNGKQINRSDGFVVQTGDNDPEGTVHGFVPPGQTEERKVPLEIAIKGEKDLLYASSTEDDGRRQAETVLPFQAYGALGMAREEFDAESASTQFFWLLFESDLTPAGKNLLDGRYTCFGYTVEGADLLRALRETDVIASAKVLPYP